MKFISNFFGEFFHKGHWISQQKNFQNFATWNFAKIKEDAPNKFYYVFSCVLVILCHVFFAQCSLTLFPEFVIPQIFHGTIYLRILLWSLYTLWAYIGMPNGETILYIMSWVCWKFGNHYLWWANWRDPWSKNDLNCVFSLTSTRV
jgi:hypothetical protein